VRPGQCAQTDYRTSREGGNDNATPHNPGRPQKGECHEREAECRVSRYKRAVSLALRCRQRRGRELPRSAKRLDLRWPRASSMVFENDICEEARTERKRSENEDKRFAVKPPDRSVKEQEPDRRPPRE